MKIVYDMRTGEIVEHTAEPCRDVTEVDSYRPSASRAEPALQLAEYGWSDRPTKPHPEFVACYFDEVGD